MKKRLALIGSRDLAQLIIDQAIATGEYEIFGYFDDFEENGTVVNGYKVYGKVDDAITMFKHGLFDCIFIAIGYGHFDARERFYDKVKGIIPLATIISSGAFVDKTAIIGEGVYIAYGTQIGRYCVVEDNVLIGCSILGHNNFVGKHTYISGNMSMAGFSSIGRRCFLGIGVLVNEKISICDDTWIGIGMIVYKNIKKSGKYAVFQKIIKID